ncbi:MAG: DNA-3-methyladenine glycosylase I [Xanthomonadales bacterium]|nr:DNA-3-methyladenine glycosylase I [Xanthomonadales bacterium]NIX11597.1 DNA-3-methyladenine glycosylase I [Xanthomonadales bacterium]
MPESGTPRCAWAGDDPLNVAYHDEEWGVPVRDEHRLFEMLTLEGAQAGLSWLTILRKREGYRRLFADFDPQRVAGFDDATVERLLRDPAIVRHRGKIEAAINNARRIMALWEQGDSLEDLVWEVVDGQPVVNRWRRPGDLPASTGASARLSKRLKKLGFRFVGPTTCYAFMQAAGLVNDHESGCFRHPDNHPASTDREALETSR